MPSVDDVVSLVRASENRSRLPIKLVAIDGHGGSGKSTLAAALSASLGAEVLHTDDFASWDNPLDWWPRLITDVLDLIAAGDPSLSYQRGSWGPDHRPEPVVGQPVTSVMLLEGVSSARREFRSYLSMAVWVDTPRDLCLTRGLARDGVDARQQWETWLAAEDEYIARDQPHEFADITVSGTSSG
jgi:uridine kinase